MRILTASILLLCSAALLLQNVAAQDAKKEVTLKGKITCAKCDLDVETACTTVIVVKVDKKDVIYYFDKEGHKKHHGAVCSASMEGSVTGVVSEDGKKKIITVKTLKFD
jgi:Family of unknown function (DUF6370)